MCGIAGIIYRDTQNGAHRIGSDMTLMLQSMKHRGPDSTGYALYGPPREALTMRVKLADTHAARDFDFDQRLARRRAEVEGRVRTVGGAVSSVDETTDHTMTVHFDYDGELKLLADHVEAIREVEVLSLGHSLEIVKDLGDAETVARDYKLSSITGSHAIGHVRMATESDVDISGAHPYWAYPFSDIAVVHNGQLTNYHYWRRRLERSGHRFQSECDSEIIAVYLAEQMSGGASLEESMRASLDELDGVFTYICVTEDALGMAKDELAAKPLVLYESDDIVALASEEIAIRAVIDREIDTYDPFEGEVMVWTR
jgi:methylamine---glutamate N-methyltransferase subunit A